MLFNHGIRGGHGIYNVRRGEVTEYMDPAHPGQVGVKFEESLPTKTLTVDQAVKDKGSSSSCHIVKPIVWCKQWADLLRLYKSKLPRASHAVLRQARCMHHMLSVYICI